MVPQGNLRQPEYARGYLVIKQEKSTRILSALSFYIAAKNQLLFLIIYPLYPITDARQYLVGNGINNLCQNGRGEFLAKDEHGIALLTGDIRYINHADIHTDVSHIAGFLSVYQTVAVATSQESVQPVGITDGNGSDEGS